MLFRSNGTVRQRNVNPYTGRLDAVLMGANDGADGVATPNIQNDAYAYDVVGNLTTRSQVMDANGGLLIETFGYDGLNRLTSSQVIGQTQKTYGYDDVGNLTNKSGTILTYQSGGARPHAPISVNGTVLGVVNPSATYDANGNIKSLAAGGSVARNLNWMSFNLPSSITRGNFTTNFVYGPEQQRVKQSISNGTTIYYGGAIEKEISPKIGRAHV